MSTIYEKNDLEYGIMHKLHLLQHASCLTHNITYIAPNYIFIYLSKQAI